VISRTRRSASARRRGGVVVIVDDERSLLITLERRLRRLGFRALCVESSHLAIRVLEIWPVTVVVADQRMPDMDGLDLLEVVARRWPACERILITGDVAAVEDVCRRRGITVIDKGEAFGRLLEELWFLTGERHGRQE
jgi:DNA-binding NtrC family response regulator